MFLAEEMVPSNPIRTPSEHQKCVIARERSLMALSWDRTKFSHDIAKAASRFLAVIAFSDHSDSFDPNTDDSGSSVDPPASDRGVKRAAEVEAPAPKPAKKPRRPNSSAPIPPKTQVACLTNGSANAEWVLGRVSQYLPESKKYEVADEEETYKVSRKNIRVIPKKPHAIEPKARVLAVYPCTTVFYPAVLVGKSGKIWQVEFDDEDADETNIIKEIKPTLVMLP